MIKLTDCISTPQIFFNKRHIGGASELASLIQQYNKESQLSGYPSVFERISMEVLKGQRSPTKNGMLGIPKTTDAYTTEKRSILEQNERIRSSDVVQIINGEESTVGKITTDLMKWLPRRKVGWLSRNKNCFSANDAISCFMEHYHFPSSKSAISFGQHLLRLGIFHRVSTDIIPSDLFSERGYFRIQPLRSPEILNSFRIWTGYDGLYNHSFPDIDPSLTMLYLIRQMTEIITSATSAGGKVDYGAAQMTTKFRNFEENICQLQLAKVEMMNEESKKAFFINVYNLMMTHAFFRLRPKKVNDQFMASVHYNVGGFVFSLEDIYHGILRNNSKHPKTCTKMFPESDVRATISLQKVDARIHFALNNGSGSCVVVHEYNMEAIDEELRVIAQLYCASNERVFICSSTNNVILPKFMRIHLSDFTKNGETRRLPEAISKYLSIDRRNALDRMQIRENKTGLPFNVLFGDKPVSLLSNAMKHGCLRSINGKRSWRLKPLSKNWVELCSDCDDSTIVNPENKPTKFSEQIDTLQHELEAIGDQTEEETDSIVAPVKGMFPGIVSYSSIPEKVPFSLSSKLENPQPIVANIDSVTPTRCPKIKNDILVTPCQKKLGRTETPPSISSIQTARTMDGSIHRLSSSPLTVTKIHQESSISTSDSIERTDTELADPPQPLRLISGDPFMKGQGNDPKFTFTLNSFPLSKPVDITDCARSLLSSSIISFGTFDNPIKHAPNDGFEALYSS